MKFLDMELCRQHLRIEDDEFTEQESLIRHYAESAEDLVLNWIERSYDDVVAEYGEFLPISFKQLSLFSLRTMSSVRALLCSRCIFCPSAILTHCVLTI